MDKVAQARRPSKAPAGRGLRRGVRDSTPKTQNPRTTPPLGKIAIYGLNQLLSDLAIPKHYKFGRGQLFNSHWTERM